MSEPTEEQLVAAGVDLRPWGPTEPDEEQVLRGLGYVLNPLTGTYEGDPHDEDGAPE
ncbi:hypothetical protein [Nonomuraea endophytica]|uniref:Uncharacterized protein n=1 Tax=Nonomuraea endophytica TaxID=714136 RepID=A0A7W8A8B0_9ACTN|nr:hypothetical protein [Nonomuraea endophytica]MBB5081390.1 hypothetical protein [Nonomuraea endophytica]